MPTSTNFDDIRKWHNHYGSGGALYPSWSLGQTELRYMAEKKTGAVSLNDFSGRIGYLAKDPSHIGTSSAFLYPGRTKIDLMSSPSNPTYESVADDTFGDPMGNYLRLRCQGGTISSAVFGSVQFYYNINKALTISFDFVHRANLPAPEFNLVIVERKARFSDTTNQRVLHSSQPSNSNSTAVKNFTESITFSADYPYKVISLQNNIGPSGPANDFTLVNTANMRITE